MKESFEGNSLLPLAKSLAQKTVGTTPCPRFLDSQIRWLSLSGANLMMAHGVGVPSNHSTTELSMSLRDEAVANQIWWF